MAMDKAKEIFVDAALIKNFTAWKATEYLERHDVNVDKIFEDVDSMTAQLGLPKIKVILGLGTSRTRDRFANLNEKACIPRFVSFGPYHHKRNKESKSALEATENHKKRVFFAFLRKCTHSQVVDFVCSFSKMLNDLIEFYPGMDGEWRQNPADFLQMMILDGYFMLELLRFNDSSAGTPEYGPSDPIFSYRGMIYCKPFIKTDMLLLENQLPLTLLVKFLVWEGKTEADAKNEVKRLILKFYFSGNSEFQPINKDEEFKHVLDLYRKSIIFSKQPRSPPPSHQYEGLERSATELHQRGIKFEKSNTKRLDDMSFHSGVLKLPEIQPHDTTEEIWQNLIAWELVDGGSEVISYVHFMHILLRTEDDVAFLCKKGLIQTSAEQLKAIVQLFNSLSEIISDHEHNVIDDVRQQVYQGSRRPWNEFYGYFRRNRALVIFGFIAAPIGFILTLIQTIYTVYSAYHK